MKQLIISTICVAAFAATACDDEFPSREASPYDSPNSMKVRFADVNAKYALGVNDNEIQIDFCRSNASAATTVDLTSFSTNDALEIPSSVTFNAGDTSASITIKLKENFELFKSHMLYISMNLTPEQSDFYSDADKSYNNVPQLSTTIEKTDFKPYGMGLYFSPMFGDWEQEIEYSEITKAYRLADVIEPGSGCNLVFKMNEGSDTYFKVTSGTEIDKDIEWASGVEEEGYGMIYLTYTGIDSPNGDYYHGTYEDNVYTFTSIDCHVAAGSFGAGYSDTYTLTQVY